MQHSNNSEGINIDLGRVVHVLRRKLWLIALSAAMLGILAFSYAAIFVTPTYTSGFTAYINNRVINESTAIGSSTSTGELAASMGLTYVYQQIITSRSVLSEAIKKCGYSTDYHTLRSAVTVAVAEDAPVLSVNVEMPDPQMAQDFAMAIAAVAPAHMTEVVEYSSMHLIDEPLLPGGPSSPVLLDYLVYGALVGLVLAGFGVVIADIINDYVVADSELERRYDISVIGSIPEFAQASRRDVPQYGKRVQE